MKNITLLFFLLLSAFVSLRAQSPGDTMVTPTFTYTSGTRDTMIHFPDIQGLTYEKVFMLYNMRCKNGLVSPPVTGQTNIGCGEWDYSCNTYITDSSKVDSTKAKHPSHTITGFAGASYAYTTQPTYTFYQYTQQNVSYTSTISETMATVGNGLLTTNAPFNTQNATSKSQFLWTAAELSAAGLLAGDISSIKLNVSNVGSDAQFLKVRMKHSLQSILNASSPDLTGFTEVYFLNTALGNGLNQLNFYQNFAWNGTDNILVEFSYSNAINGADNIVLSDTTSGIMGLVSAGNDYSFEFTGSNHIDLGNANFSNFSNQISIAFWSYGNAAALPTNTSVIYATNAQNHRQANIHFPWSDGNIYWDCGSGGSYDRINKAATANDYEGKWNYWVFTKNKTTGVMNAYLNGILWHTGTGKTIPIQITNFMLGGDPNMTVPYFGKIDEFSLWNIALSPATIQAWMKKGITPMHPNYANLIAYYKHNEGTGSMTNDVSTAAATGSVSGTPVWSLVKGKDIFKEFAETNNRPMLTFVQGTYVQTTTPILVMDSIQNTTNIVYSFGVTNNNIVSLDTNTYYHAGYSYVYEGDTGMLLDSVNYTSMGTIDIVQLDYYQKSPSRFQIMSFVTPYGINLDLGINGKTWTFDVSDFAPFLKGWKRLSMDAGGQWQENMDIKFLFVVGTPPQNVLDIRNIWKVESVGYTSILNDDKFEPRSFLLDATGNSFKIKSAITGHGQEGEFIQRTHQLNVDGGNTEFSWQVWKECALNPVYPQGGTWIYDRAGWCPGMATDIKELDITPYVIAGTNANLDYHLITASGSSNYWVSNQLVTYGAPNFSLDAALIDVKNPSNKVEYARTNSICNKPTVVIQNTGSTTLTNLEIEYWVNNNAVHEIYNWTGNLAFLKTTDVVLPVGALWSSVNVPNGNVFHVKINNPNGGTDGYSFNNHYNSPFNITSVLPSTFVLWTKMNLAGAETKYRIYDAANTLIFDRSGLISSKEYKDTLHLGVGCYVLAFSDIGDDGIDFWANNDGVGFARINQLSGANIINFEGDFGKSLIYNFTIDFPLAFEELYGINDISLYPNPAHNEVILEGKNIEKAAVMIFNDLGQQMNVPVQTEANKMTFNTIGLSSGLYFVLCQDKDGKMQTKKLVISR